MPPDERWTAAVPNSARECVGLPIKTKRARCPPMGWGLFVGWRLLLRRSGSGWRLRRPS